MGSEIMCCNLKNCRSTNVFYDHFRLVTVHGCLFVNKCTKLPCKMRCSYTKRVSLDLQTLFWLMVLVAMTTRKLAKRKTNMFFLWGKLFNKRSAPYPTKMQNPALQKKKTIKIIYPQHKSRHYMSTLYSSKLNWRSFSVLQYP